MVCSSIGKTAMVEPNMGEGVVPSGAPVRKSKARARREAAEGGDSEVDPGHFTPDAEGAPGAEREREEGGGPSEEGPRKATVVVVDSVKRQPLQERVRRTVEKGSMLFSDALRSYEGLADTYHHEVVNHAKEYVRGNVHTNGIENFWSLLKRSIKGTYVSVEPFHLFRYLDEQSFRYNNRKDKRGDSGRFLSTLASIVGRRVSYDVLTGRGDPQT